MTDPSPTTAYLAGFNAGIDRARKVLESRCAYVFDAALKAEKMDARERVDAQAQCGDGNDHGQNHGATGGAKCGAAE